MDKYMPEADKADSNTVYGYAVAQTLVQVLEQCADDLTRANVTKQAANLKNLRSDMLLPGITTSTGPADFFPIEQLQLMQFDGQAYRLRVPGRPGSRLPSLPQLAGAPEHLALGPCPGGMHALVDALGRRAQASGASIGRPAPPAP